MVTIDKTITMKKAAVGHVHAIQDKPMPLPPRLYAAESKALGDVVAHEIDDDRSGHDGERPGSGQ